MIALGEGHLVSLYTDRPVTPLDSLFTMWCAVNCLTRSGQLVGASGRTSPEAVLRAVPLGSDYLKGRDEEIGSIELDQWAAFTVLSDCPLSVAQGAARRTTVPRSGEQSA